jgi:hypothetical protein
MAHRRKSGKRAVAPEWVGGLLSPPFFIQDREEPYRIRLATWLELPSGLIVGQQVLEAGESSGGVGRVLREALERPAAGAPRRPGQIRVGDATLAAEVRAAIGDSIPVRVAPTPELDELLELMIETMPDQSDEASYLEGGRIPAEAVAMLFDVTAALCHVAPWTAGAENLILRIDIPALAVDGACVVIIGEEKRERGLLIFPSYAGHEAFIAAGMGIRPEQRQIELGTEWLALTLEPAADLPRSMRKEAAAHGWVVADVDSYPRLQGFERDGALRPLVERDLEIATYCAGSVGALFLKHAALFETDAVDPICESFFDARDVEVRLTVPYEALELFDVDETPESPLAETERGEVGRKSSRHDLEWRLYRRLEEFAESRFGAEWRRFERDFADAREAIQFSAPWSVYGYGVQGATVLEWYLEERGRELTRDERAWAAAQQAAWLSIWEVIAVEPGASLTLRDLLSGEERLVREVSGSRTLVARDALLARIVEHDGASLLCGAHPRPLPPLDASEVERRAQGRLRRKRAVPVERLRDAAFGGYLIRRWEEAVAGFDLRRTAPRDLRNTDGDSLLLTTDHFEIVTGARAEVEARLTALEDVKRHDDAGAGACAFDLFDSDGARRPEGQRVVIGQVFVTDTKLSIETNSVQRADALRRKIEAACGERVRHRVREHADPQSSRAFRATGGPGEGHSSSDERAVLREIKRRHYADWADHPLPALGGKTPREAVRTVSGRANVDLLLRQMENQEQRVGDGAPFDFTGIRRELRLD